MEEVVPIFLLDQPQRTRRVRDRRVAAALAVQKVFEALSERNISSEEWAKRHHKIPGKLADHAFDVVVGNGKALFAAQGLSFEVDDSAGLRKDVDATAWAIDDVKKRNRSLPLAVLALPPRKESEIFVSAERIFKGLGAAVVPEDQMGQWARKEAKRIPLRLLR